MIIIIIDDEDEKKGNIGNSAYANSYYTFFAQCREIFKEICMFHNASWSGALWPCTQQIQNNSEEQQSLGVLLSQAYTMRSCSLTQSMTGESI